MRKMMKFGSEWYYLNDVHTFKRDATEHVKELKGRGYLARVKNIPEGWGVYYR